MKRLALLILVLSTSALAQLPQGSPTGPSDALLISKVTYAMNSDIQKFLGLATGSELTEVALTREQTGFQVTFTSKACKTAELEPQPQDPQALPFALPGYNCDTAKLIIQASISAEGPDGYTYNVLVMKKL